MRDGIRIPDDILKSARREAEDFLRQATAWQDAASVPEILSLLQGLSAHRVMVQSDHPDSAVAAADEEKKWLDYISDLEGYPKWVLIQACEVARRETGDRRHDFFPRSAHLRALCEAAYEPIVSGVAAARRVATYSPPAVAREADPDQRAQDRAYIQALTERTIRAVRAAGGNRITKC